MIFIAILLLRVTLSEVDRWSRQIMKHWSSWHLCIVAIFCIAEAALTTMIMQCPSVVVKNHHHWRLLRRPNQIMGWHGQNMNSKLFRFSPRKSNLVFHQVLGKGSAIARSVHLLRPCSVLPRSGWLDVFDDLTWSFQGWKMSDWTRKDLVFEWFELLENCGMHRVWRNCLSTKNDFFWGGVGCFQIIQPRTCFAPRWL